MPQLIQSAPASSIEPLMPSTPALGRESRYIRRGSAKKGCLIALAIFLVLVVGVVIFVAVSWKGIAASSLTAFTTQMVTQSDLPQDQKDRVIAKVKSIGDDFKNGKVSFAQLGKVMGAIAEGPVLPLGIVAAVEGQYIKPSTLTDQEKTDASRTLERFARGIAEKKIDMSVVKTVLGPISQPGTGDQIRLKQAALVKPEELRALLADAKKRADDASIPDEAYAVNVADELDKAVNQALGK